MDRGTRIAQKARNRAKAEKIVRGWGPVRPQDRAWFDRTVRMLAAHGKLCSCIMCGNRRKSDGPTIQELRATGD